MKYSIPDQFLPTVNEQWDKLVRVLEEKQIISTGIDAIETELKWLFFSSEFIFKSCLFLPDMLSELVSSDDLNKSYTSQNYKTQFLRLLKSVHDEAELEKALRRFRCREMVRIAWRDLTQRAELNETLVDLTNLAEACIDQTFEILHQWHVQKMGTPRLASGEEQKLIVLGMGKLGAWELNFSSDIDLIFAFCEAGETTGGPRSVSHEEFFASLARKFIKVFNTKGPEGIVYRVDMRLRPFGENGPLVMSLNAMHDYFQLQGSEWERYAMIKARPVAGDRAAGRQLLEDLKPFVYRRYFDYAVYESLREMKKKISLEVSKKGMIGNIKLGAGGIREIEFFGQMFQLVRGGVDPLLQEVRILKVIEALVNGDYITAEVGNELTAAYKFLRIVENRLQQYQDKQTHSLPKEEDQRLRLAVSAGYANWSDFSKQLEFHQSKVQSQFDELLNPRDESQEESSEQEVFFMAWQGMIEESQFDETMIQAGFSQPSEIKRLIDFLRNDTSTRSLSPKGRERLDKLMPRILSKVLESKQPEVVFDRIVHLIKAIQQRTNYLSLLIENPDVIGQLVRLSDASPWIMAFLNQHPVLLDELIDPQTLFAPPDKQKLESMLELRLSQLTDDELELKLEELTIFKNINTLHVAAADISGAFPLIKVSDYLTDTAETILSKIHQISYKFLLERYGKPVCQLKGGKYDSGFCVIAYGKFGGVELGYGSDLDLVFLHAAADEETRGGKESIDSPQFFSRLGQRIVHLLGAHNKAGRLYQIDMRLRPSGNSGILVSQIDAFREYQLKEAWTWEHQALIKARPVVGDQWLSSYFESIRSEVLCQKRDKETLKKEIKDMREKMQGTLRGKNTKLFDFKKGRGGIVDIEFMVQYLVLLHAHQHEELVAWTETSWALDILPDYGLLEKEKAEFLKDAYITYRAQVHRFNLMEKPALVDDQNFLDLRNRVREIWEELLG